MFHPNGMCLFFFLKKKAVVIYKRAEAGTVEEMEPIFTVLREASL